MPNSKHKTPTQQVKAWAAEVYTSPRCDKYPACGGEDGSGVLQTDDARSELDRMAQWGAGTSAYKTRIKELTASAPRCKQCAAYARAVERLIERLEK